MISKRSDDYRYTVDIAGAEITPLALVEAFVGPLQVHLHNISAGGLSMVFDQDPPIGLGDIADISVSIRGRAFPIQIEVKNERGRRLNCAFVSTPRSFQSALQEFLQPKFLGEHIARNLALSTRAGAVELVENAAHHDAFTGQNQTGFFVWRDAANSVLKWVGVSRDLVFEWSRSQGLKTGRLTSDRGVPATATEDVQWDRVYEVTILHYFADILLAWLKSEEGARFVHRLMGDQDSSEPLFFPDP